VSSGAGDAPAEETPPTAPESVASPPPTRSADPGPAPADALEPVSDVDSPEPAEPGPTEPRPTESWPTEPRATDTRPTEPRPASSTGGPAPLARRSARAWRDRHGRGIRGPLLPASVPLTRTRGDSFDEVVLDAAARLRTHLPERTPELQFSVEDIPPPSVTDALLPGEPVPLGSAIPADGDRPARVVVYRRTVELRVGSGPDTAELVYDVVVEQAADLLGMPPEEIDPEFGEDED